MGMDLLTVQRLVTTLLNLAVGLITGASFSRLWLGRQTSPWAEVRRLSVHGVAIVGVAIALLANVVALWLEAAVMAEVPVTEAGGAAYSMLTSTHFGLAWAIGMVGLVVASIAACWRGNGSPRPALLSLVSLGMFWYTRSMVSHAAAEGDFSLPLLADWLHLSLISLWVGEVILAGTVMLRKSDMTAVDRRARAAYVASLSSSATVALTGIFVTGLYAAWRNLGGLGNLVGNPYGNTLVAKLLLVGIAAILGGFNRFFVMPPWLAHESAGSPVAELLPTRFRHVLWIEAIVLATVIMLAAWLASTSPPGEQM